MLNEAIPPEISGAILTALHFKGVSADELAGMAEVLQAQCVGRQGGQGGQGGISPSSPPTPPLSPSPLIDTCGTGGDGASTFNISTAVAFVAAAYGVKVAKHGNRSASSRVGSADVLEALGVNLAVSSDKVQAALQEVGITFLFAPGWHPALKAVASLRRTLKVRTVFNLHRTFSKSVASDWASYRDIRSAPFSNNCSSFTTIGYTKSNCAARTRKT